MVNLPLVPPLVAPVLLPLELPPDVPPLVSASASKSWKTTDRPQPTAAAAAATSSAAPGPLPPLTVRARIAQKLLLLMQMPRSGSFTMNEQNWFCGQLPPTFGSQISLQVPPKPTAPPKHIWPAGQTCGRSSRDALGLQSVGPLLPPCQQ